MGERTDSHQYSASSRSVDEPDQIRRVVDSIVDAVPSLDETELLIWVGMTFKPAAIVDAAAEIATLGSPNRTERCFSSLQDEYRTRAANQDQRTIMGGRAANSFSDVHTFYGLTVLRTAWYKHPEYVVDS